MLNRNHRWTSILLAMTLSLGMVLTTNAQEAKSYNYQQLMERFQSQSTLVEKMEIANRLSKDNLDKNTKQFDLLDGRIQVTEKYRNVLDQQIEMESEDKKKAEIRTLYTRAYQDAAYKSAVKQSMNSYLNLALVKYQNDQFATEIKRQERISTATFSQNLYDYRVAEVTKDYLTDQEAYLKAEVKKARLEFEEGLITASAKEQKELALLALNLEKNKVSNQLEKLTIQISNPLKLESDAQLSIDLKPEDEVVVEPLTTELFNKVILKRNSVIMLNEYKLSTLDLMDEMINEVYRDSDDQKKILLLNNQKTRISTTQTINQIKTSLKNRHNNYANEASKYKLAKKSYELAKDVHDLSVRRYEQGEISKLEKEGADLSFRKATVDLYNAFVAYDRAWNDYEKMIYGS